MLTKAIEILHAAKEGGIELLPGGDQLQVRVPKGVTIDPVLLAAIREHKQALISYLADEAMRSQRPEGSIALRGEQRTDGLMPLSFAQERLWFIDRMQGSAAYHIPFTFRMNGALDKVVLEKAFRLLIRRHEVLRSVVKEVDGAGYQLAKDGNDWNINFVTIDEKNISSYDYIQELVEAPFDLGADYPLRVDVLQAGKEEFYLVAVLHHIVCDGWSIGILVRELGELYEAGLANRDAGLSPLPIQYGDFANWQRRHLDGPGLEEHLSYWKKKLENVPPLTLPFDKQRPAQPGGKGGTVKRVLPKDLLEKLHLLSRKEGATLFMTLLAAFKVLLQRYTNESDICVGSSTAGRLQPEVEGLIGFFVNTLVLRDQIHPEQSFLRLLQRVRTTTLEAYAHQEAPFERIVETLGVERQRGQNPLYQILFTVQNNENAGSLKLGGGLVLDRVVEEDSLSAQFDLNVNAYESAEGLVMDIVYSKDLYNKNTIEQLLAHYEALLFNIVAAVDEPVGSLVMFAKDEQALLLDYFSGSFVDVSIKGTLLHVLHQQAITNADATALTQGDRKVSYEELDRKSNQLAHYLCSRGIGEGSIVGVLMNNSPELVVAIWATWKSGGAYVPLDPSHPRARIDYILQDTGAAIVLANAASEHLAPPSVGRLCLHSQWAMVDEFPSDEISFAGAPSSAAYIIYTSGSTGQPKGVVVEHASLYQYLLFARDQYIDPAGQGSGSYVHLSPGFDASLTAIWTTLMAGRQMVIADAPALEVFAGKDFSAHAPYDFIKLTPAHLSLLQDHFDTANGAATQKLVLGGEALHPAHLDWLKDRKVTIINEYGPTEATVGCATYNFTVKDKTQVGLHGYSIGRPIPGSLIYIFDEQLQPCPVGVPGELCIGGAQVARGYLNRNELTKEKFIQNPFGEGRLYRTGDGARWRGDGTLDYLGRHDEQVKIRGYRIESGEVEAALHTAPGIRQAAVVAADGAGDSKILIAYAVTDDHYEQTSVIVHLQQRLPEYMIPSAIVQLEALPLNSSGKVDRKALAAMEVQSTNTQAYSAPQTETEILLAAIWQELLEVEHVGVHDNFFDLGGHSLLAIRIISALKQKTAAAIDIKDIFDHPTIYGLAARMGKGKPGEQPSIHKYERAERLPLSFAQERLWFIDHLQGSVAYHMPFVFRVAGDLNVQALSGALQTIINRHEVLRSVIREEEGEGYQQILDAKDWKLGRLAKEDLQGLSVHQYIQQITSTPFDLSNDFLLKSWLIETAPKEYHLVILLHHIAFDGWSAGILVNELTHLYNKGNAIALPELPLQYADYAFWQREYFTPEVLAEQLGYWKEQLRNLEPVQLPKDDTLLMPAGREAGIVSVVIDNTLTGKLQSISSSSGATLFMVLLAAFKILLQRYSGQDDIGVGTPVAGRMQREWEGLIGFFVNTLVLRTHLQPAQSFASLLEEVKRITLDAYRHQQVPLEKVVEALEVSRDLDRHPLFQVFFGLNNTPLPDSIALDGISLEIEPPVAIVPKFDLSVEITPAAEGLIVEATYDKGCFSEAPVMRLLQHYQNLLQSIAEDPLASTTGLRLMNDAEQNLIITGFGASQPPSVDTRTIIDLFRERALHQPNRKILLSGEESMSYEQLHLRSNQVANYLITSGLKPGDLAGVCMGRTMDMVTVLLGVLKAGGAYIPLDPAYPKERIAYMLSDAKARFLLCDADMDAGESIHIININNYYNEIVSSPGNDPLVDVQSSDVAYVIYTSGSTGRPKGVMIEQGSVAQFIHWCEEEFKDSRFNVVYATTSICFDLSIFELFYSLCSGKTIRLLANGLSIPFALEAEGSQPVLINTVPSVVQSLLESETQWHKVGVLNMAGEPIPLDVQQGLDLKRMEVRNLYGPTEDTTYSTVYRLEKAGRALIGKPIAGTQIYILDRQLQLCPLGVPGELCLAGAGVARGYLNRPELTEEKFIPNPFGEGRMYRTGDLARWREDSQLEYMGRFDDQVKIRGYRIELGEIESALGQIKGVKQSAVVAAVNKEGQKQLVGYVVIDKNDYSGGEAMKELEARLPGFMIPAALIELDALPLNTNGKVDRKALSWRGLSIYSNKIYIAPRTEDETKLAALWQELLGVESVSLNDSFFELGGHSLLAMRLAAIVKKRLFKEVSIRQVFVTPVLEQYAAQLNAANNGQQDIITPFQRSAPLPLSFAQERLWFIDQVQGSTAYHLPYLFKINGLLDAAALEGAVRMLLQRHEVLRTIIVEEGGKAFQQIRSEKDWKLNSILLAELPDNNIDQAIQNLIETPFDLSTDYMLKMWMIDGGENERYLLLLLHHIAFDGWSVRILAQELEELYAAQLSGQSPRLPDLPVRYADFANWQRIHADNAMASHLAYWKNQLSDLQPTELATDFRRPAKPSAQGAGITKIVRRDVLDSLQALGLREGATLFMTLLAAFKVLLHRYTNESDVCVGSSTAGRLHPEVEGLIGFFVNTLVLRSHVDEEKTFVELLQQVRTTTLQAYEHQEAPFEKIVETLGVERQRGQNPLYQILFTVQNNRQAAELDFGADVQLERLLPESGPGAQFDLNVNAYETESGLVLDIVYAKELYRRNTVELFLEHYEALLENIAAEANRPLKALSMTGEEESILLRRFSEPVPPIVINETILHLLDRQVTVHSKHTALAYGERRLSFLELDQCSNQLAHYLRARGVGEGSVVGLLMDNSPELVMAAWATWKAGGAYVPLNPAHPASRIDYILKDTQALLVLTNNASEQLAPDGLPHLCIDNEWPVVDEFSSDALPINNKPSSAAYIIYTSGSTGQPKGVVVEHGNLAHYLLFAKEQYLPKGFEGSGSFVHLSPGFDASLTAIWTPLISGKKIVIAASAGLEVFTGKDFSLHAPYGFIKLTPAHLSLLQDNFEGIAGPVTDCLVLGGEALQPAHTNWLKGYDIDIINEYGPTEATVGCTTYRFNGADAGALATVHGYSIGQPIPGNGIYVLDEYLQPCPIGVPGEICIAGAQIARGYLNQPELTAEKFIPNPFGEGTMYRTGDRARWGADGALEYLGRGDDQVKIRGYRIEPGEVEAALAAAPGIQQAVVVANEDPQAGQKRLVGYVVVTKDYEAETVLAQLQLRLPPYMIPLIVELETLPLNSSGKTDRKALATRDVQNEATNEYAAPQTNIEQVLAGIWQDLLGVDRVGIHDNFFELGGDSIISVQMVSRARREGLQLQVGDVFTYQNISRLAQSLVQAQTIATVKIPEEQLTGPVGLLPIQKWFFSNNDRNPVEVLSHFNQSVLLRLDKNIDAAVLQKAVEKLVHHHDALRFSYSFDGSWQQTCQKSIDFELAIEDLGHVGASDFGKDVEILANRYQQSLDITRGRLMQIVLIRTPEEEKQNRLLLIIHHLAVDGVSWRILLEDLEQLLRNTDAPLPAKTTSCKNWHQHLQDYAENARKQSAYWQAIKNDHQPLSNKDEPGERAQLHVQLSEEQTQLLLKGTAGAYSTQINDLLLAALGRSLGDWTGKDRIVIGLEGHGREPLGNADLSRTVGWFTSLYPVSLPTGRDKDIRRLILQTKEQLRAIPGKGLGYGVLKYMVEEDAFQGTDPWDLLFNYLGQTDGVLRGDGLLQGAEESAGNNVHEKIYNYKIEIISMVSEGRLWIHFNYNSSAFDAAAVQQLAGNYLVSLEEVIQNCAENSTNRTHHNRSIPADFGLSGTVSFNELDTFLEQKSGPLHRWEQLERVYPLSPLQQGILFHTLYEEGRGAYLELFECTLAHLDVAVFTKSWQELIDHHTILRTAVYATSLSIPVQATWRHVPVPLERHDMSAYDSGHQSKLIEELRAGASRSGLDPEKAPLMQLILVKLSEHSHHLIWVSHHLILDGWSTANLLGQFLQTYDALAAWQKPEPQAVDAYEDYIRYFEKQGQSDALRDYWQRYLSPLEGGSLLPFIEGNAQERTKISGGHAELITHLGERERAAIEAYAQKHRITVNTFIQGVWAFLLSGYTNRNKVVYGITVSGRPEDLPGVEQRIGLYINTLPLYTGVPAEGEVGEWLQELQQQNLQSRNYQYTSLSELQKGLDVPGDLFDTLLIFQNYPVNEAIQSVPHRLQVSDIRISEQTNYPLCLVVGMADTLSIQWNFDPSLLLLATIKKISGHFTGVVQQIIGGAHRFEELSLLTGAEKDELLVGFQAPSTASLQPLHFIQLFNEVVTNHPQATAIVYEEESITFEGLQQRSNQLAHALIKHGVRQNDLVPVCLRNSTDLLVSIIAIWKCGAAYVPVDPAYPEERIAYLLEDTKASICISRSELMKAADRCNIFCLDNEKTDGYPGFAPPIQLSSHSPAYVIYTSGSTGRPKGVLVEHSSLAHYLLHGREQYTCEDDLSGSFVHLSATFDASLTALFVPLLAGRSIVIGSGSGTEIFSDKNFLQHAPYQFIKLTPAHLPLIEEYFTENFGPASRLIVGGEALQPAHLDHFIRHRINVEIFNEYGPTEATVGCTTCRFNTGDETIPAPSGSVSIGRPIPGNGIYIIDHRHELCAVGVPGELCIGGAQLARGYWNSEEQTDKKFIADPFGPGRLYLTGDSARWRDDGTLEYLGRLDDQVKIRGHRVETGEIEKVVQEAGGVKSAVVLFEREEKNISGQLIAFVITEEGYDKPPVMAHLRARLPDYMIPALLIEIEAIPLTTHGKIDRKELLKLKKEAGHLRPYTAPVSETEKELVQIWQELLGIVPIGIHDNFFELGGDSIISIQVVSRARKLGLTLQPRDLFLQQTIAGLGSTLGQRSEKAAVLAEQGRLSGDCGLLPVQQWFFQMQGHNSTGVLSHFNQSALLSIEKRVTVEILEAAVNLLAGHHDALHMEYKKNEEGQWQQSYGQKNIPVISISLPEESTQDFSARIEAISDQYQQSLDIERSELVRVVHIQSPAEVEGNRLLIIVHHLLIDGVSWRILVDDLEDLLSALTKGTEPSLGQKTTSYRQWCALLNEYAGMDIVQKQLPYWKKAINNYMPLPVDHPNHKDGITAADMDVFTVNLSAAKTKELIQEAGKAYATEINDLLIGALAYTLADWCGQKNVNLGLEGHGREQIDAVADTARTVGWFTVLYPLLLTIENDDLRSAILNTKEELRRLPQKGVGYGLLKYLQKTEELQGRDPWDLLFNYLGQTDGVLDKKGLLGLASESTGSSISLATGKSALIEVNCIVWSHELSMSWSFSQKHYEEATIQDLAHRYAQTLARFIDHCAEAGRLPDGGGTQAIPSDFQLSGEISFSELDAFLSEPQSELDNLMSF